MEFEALMSVQEPQDQFGRESVEDEFEESQDSVNESPLTDSDSYTPSGEYEAERAPTDESTSPSEESTPVEESEELDVPAIESMPVASSDELPAPEPTEGPAWYVIHCYSGYENKVRHNLEQRIETMGMKDRIFDVVIPTQEEIEVKDGKRRTVERHIFPGYVLVNMVLTEESWYVVRNTPGVTGFVGMGNNPTPLRPEEVAQIVKRMEAEAPTVKVTFKGWRARPDHRWTVQRLPRCCLRDRHGAHQGTRDGVVLWARNTCRAGFLAGRKSIALRYAQDVRTPMKQ
jgi:transcriptional antiterminator NusG